jgi:phosphate transport system substrate-binding protein
MIRRRFASFIAALLPLVACSLCAAQQAPKQGPIRIWGHGALGHDYIESLVMKWEDGFRRLHPEVHFDNELHGTASAIGALYTGTGDIAIMGREIWPVETEAFTDIRHYPPLGIDIVTGSLDKRNKDFALVVFVNRKNPIAHLSFPQLARIFGAEQKPVATWGELGLTGVWANRPVHVFGFEISRGFGYYFEQRIFNGSAKWNPELIELGDVKQTDGSLLDAGQRIVDSVGTDPDAIGYSSLLYKDPNVRAVAIGQPGGHFVLPTHNTIADHSYPLTRTITAYIDRPPGGTAGDPRITAFLEYVLSPEGQQSVIEDGGYTALPPSLARVEAAKLHSSTRHSHTAANQAHRGNP